MKKLYLLFSCMLCAVFLMAQPTLQYPDNVPEIGDVVQIQFVNTDALSTGPSGADVTWDYSTIETQYGGVIAAIDPSQSPSGGDFPGADLVLNMNDMSYTYVKTDADGFYYLGSNSTFDTIESLLVYSDSRTFIKFPFTYLDTYSDGYKGVVTTSIAGASVHVTAQSEMLADAYGTLILPTGTYNNTLRVMTIDEELDSVFVGGIYVGKSYEITRVQYSWYQADSKNPLMSIELLTNPLSASVDTVAYYMTSGSNIQDYAYEPVSMLSVYPNPAEDHLMVEYELSGNYITTISIVNQVGQLMHDRTINNKGIRSVSEKIDVSNMPSGMYFVNVSCNCGEQITKKFVIR